MVEDVGLKRPVPLSGFPAYESTVPRSRRQCTAVVDIDYTTEVKYGLCLTTMSGERAVHCIRAVVRRADDDDDNVTARDISF